MYLYSKLYDVNVIDVKDGILHTDITYRPSEKPVRQYITFKKYKDLFYWKNRGNL